MGCFETADFKSSGTGTACQNIHWRLLTPLQQRHETCFFEAGQYVLVNVLKENMDQATSLVQAFSSCR
ncbi:hypothetical protein N7519_001902 [Penicillium mononematosum]|uniref:uncharacterized protein n=1 Tax=Penicillium mononematosum TaxID=268346 RepID=UPI00254743BE|nr:uncharacterized protein N7519_001902 [Penicillium mononematosum]KAJ6186994.1 hypothetical protein N7519_001902 [Penicillium mononematosum]